MQNVHQPPPSGRRMTDEQIDAMMPTVPSWQLLRDGKGGSSLSRTIKFPSFEAVIAYMAQAAGAISALNHHPDWRNSWKTLSITLSTHDQGDSVTALDFALAEALDRLLPPSPSSTVK